MKLDKYAATYEDEVVAVAKSLPEIKEKLANIDVPNLYPSFNIYEVKIKQIDRCFIPRVHSPEELKTPTA